MVMFGLGLLFVMYIFAAYLGLIPSGIFSDSVKEDNTEINVVVNSVDNGLLRGKSACEWGDAYAYYEAGKLSGGINPCILCSVRTMKDRGQVPLPVYTDREYLRIQ